MGTRRPAAGCSLPWGACRGRPVMARGMEKGQPPGSCGHSRSATGRTGSTAGTDQGERCRSRSACPVRKPARRSPPGGDPAPTASQGQTLGFLWRTAGSQRPPSRVPRPQLWLLGVGGWCPEDCDVRGLVSKADAIGGRAGTTRGRLRGPRSPNEHVGQAEQKGPPMGRTFAAVFSEFGG